MDDLSHCENPYPYPVNYLKSTWIVGLALASISYGVLIILGCCCLTALKNRPDKGTRRSRLSLIMYVLSTMIIATVAEAYDAAVTTTAVLDRVCTDANLMPTNPFVGGISIVFFLMNIVTDGLLVWRCYAITTGFRGRKWILAWAVPLTVYLGMLVTAVISCSNTKAAVLNGLVTTLFAISLFLNVTISTSIIILLLHYKKMANKAFGRDAGIAYLNIITMLLESGSLIVVIDVIAIATIRGSAAGYVVWQMWVNTQPIASLLIIYQVARGVDYFNRKAEVTEALGNASTEHGITDSRDEPRRSDSGMGTLVETE